MAENAEYFADTTGSILDYLQTIASPSATWAVEVKKNNRTGLLHLENHDIVAAQCGLLVGNGALLTIANWQNVGLRRVSENKELSKNISISLADLKTELARHPPHPEDASFDEIAHLKQAILMIYKFQFKEAGAKLAEILKYNRYNYIAWLWYSRIVGKTESILKTLNEAQKWGNADRDILLENKRNRLLLSKAPATVKRCPFCWTVLVDTLGQCSNCSSMLKIQEQQAEKKAKHNLLEIAVTRFQRIHSVDPKNSHVAYCLALVYFNLNNFEKSLGYLRIADRHSTSGQLYRQAIDTLEKMVQKKTAAGQPPAARRPAIPVPLPSANKKSILVIEDSQTARKVVAMLLTREGYQVVEASTGSDGIMLARELAPSLILLDIMLPDMTGYDVLPRLKDMPHLKDIPVIMLTGKTGSTDRVLGMRLGSSEYLTKPFNPQKLIGTIKKYV